MFEPTSNPNKPYTITIRVSPEVNEIINALAKRYKCKPTNVCLQAVEYALDNVKPMRKKRGS
jgi:predicted transcriptional regulator